MRIVLILLMCWGVAFGQDTTKYFKSVDYGWNWQRGKFRGGLILPTDTTNNKLGIAQIGATCFAWSGLKWGSIGSTDTSFLVRYYRKNQVDSAIAANSPALTLQDVTTNGKTTTDSIIAASFKRTGGTSSQFLKANGSVDNSTYVPYSSYGSNNVSANNFFDGFSSVAASGTQIVLTVNSTPSYLVTGSGGQTIKLPDATTLPNGTLFNFNNNQSSGAILVNNNSNTLVKSVPSGGNIIIELIDNSIAAGSWDAHSQAPSNVNWSTNTFDYTGSVTSATWNGVNVALNRGGTGANTASAARTNLGSTTVGDNFFTLTNPSAKRFTQINADNTVSTLDSTAFRTAIGAGTSSTNGTVTSLTLGRGITGTSPITSTGTIGLDTTRNYTWTGFNTFNPSVSGASSIGVSMTPTNTTTANSQIHYGLKVAQTLTNSGNFTNQSRALDVSIGTASLIFGDFNSPNAYSNSNNEPSLFINRTASSGWSNLYFSNTFQTGFSAGLRFNNTGELRLGTFLSGGWTDIYNNTTEVARFTGGNLLLQNGGTFTDNTVDRLQINGNLNLTTAGNKLKIATGTNASVGTVTLSGGTSGTIPTTAVTANSIIMLTLQSCSTCGTPYISAKTAGTSFVITSTNVLDASIVAWQIIN
jgi:hypothetical protein